MGNSDKLQGTLYPKETEKWYFKRRWVKCRSHSFLLLVTGRTWRLKLETLALASGFPPLPGDSRGLNFPTFSVRWGHVAVFNQWDLCGRMLPQSLEPSVRIQLEHTWVPVFLLLWVNTVLLLNNKTPLLFSLPFGLLWIHGGKQECRQEEQRRGSWGCCGQH